MKSCDRAGAVATGSGPALDGSPPPLRNPPPPPDAALRGLPAVAERGYGCERECAYFVQYHQWVPCIASAKIASKRYRKPGLATQPKPKLPRPISEAVNRPRPAVAAPQPLAELCAPPVRSGRRMTSA